MCLVPGNASRVDPRTSKNLYRLLEREILSHRLKSTILFDRLSEGAPGDPLIHSIRALATLLGGTQGSRLEALPHIVAAEARLSGASNADRANSYSQAARNLCEGLYARAAEILEMHALANPDDILAVKFCTTLQFMTGDVPGMLRVTRKSLERSCRRAAEYGYLLGCHAFALEESREYSTAEAFGLQAVERAPDDAWGMHAVAHVFEMTGRPQCGWDWLKRTEVRWKNCNGFAFHIAWHRALFELRLGKLDIALETYDHEVRAVKSEAYRDIANAVSMLVRLEQHGVKVGVRWNELAEISRRRSGDFDLIFSLLHNLISSVRKRDFGTINSTIETIRLWSFSRADQGHVAAKVGLALASAIARPKHSGLTASKLQGILENLHLIGGSRAQRDIFVLFLLNQTSIQQIPGTTDCLLAYRKHYQQEMGFDPTCNSMQLESRPEATLATAVHA